MTVDDSCFGCQFKDAEMYSTGCLGISITTYKVLHCFQMEWSKMKTKGITPPPRSGHAGILIGDKWYIAGGETRGRGEFMAIFFSIFLEVGT